MKKNNKPSRKPTPLNNLARLSGIGIQMGIIIALGSYGGKKLDEYYQLEKKWFTIGLTLLAVAAALYLTIKQINKLNND